MTTPQGLADLSIWQAAEGIRRKQFSPTELVSASSERMRATDPRLNAWVFVDTDAAITSASNASRELEVSIDRGPLHGVPLGVKDIFDVQGWVTRCGSASRLDAPVAARDSSSVAALRAAGAVLLGKTTTQEFAAGVISAPARNPWDPERIPGGSSGGSAAAVAVGSCFGAMGSDTGGSIRIPAAACGVVGFKPAFGQLESSGVFPLSWSLDTVGPIARTVEDAWILWRSLQGLDAWPGERFNDDTDLEGIRVGIADGYFLDSLQPEVRIAVQTTAHRLEELGAEIVSASWADAAAARAAAFIINRVETAAVHGRVAVDHPDQFRLYGPDLRLRVAAGLAVPAASYIAAVRAREIIKKSVAAHFAKHRIHVLLAPTLPTTAVDAADLAIHGTGLDEGIGAAWTRLTMPFNATGQPVLALPAALDGRNLPIGIQLAGRPNDEETLFCIGHRLERAIGFAQRTGPLLAKISCDHAKESPSELTR